MVRHSTLWNRSPIQKTRPNLRAVAIGAFVGVAIAFSWLIANAAAGRGVHMRLQISATGRTDSPSMWSASGAA